MKFKRQKSVTAPLLLSVAACLLGSAANAADVKVVLFGQPCVLRGPLETGTLKSIHQISPEQIFGSQDGITPSKKQTLVLLNRLTKSPPVPNALDRYKERLKKRLEAQIDFFDSFDEYRHTGKIETLTALMNRRVLPKSQKEFEALVKKGADKGVATQEEKIFENYLEMIEPDPEEEFHRGIQKIHVQYICSFDEGSHEGEESSE